MAATYIVVIEGTWSKQVSMLNGIPLPKVLADISTRMKDDLQADEVLILPTDALYPDWTDPRYPTVTGTFRFTKHVKRHPNVNSMDEARGEAMHHIVQWLDNNTCSAPEIYFYEPGGMEAGVKNLEAMREVDRQVSA